MAFERYQLNDLTTEEHTALRSYKAASSGAHGKSPCFDLNRQLEHGMFADEMGELQSAVVALDAVFERCPQLDEQLTVYRSIGTRLHYPLTLREHKFRNLSFWSTSLNIGTAKNFLKAEARNSSGALLELNLPVGLHIYNLETLKGAGGSEREILLPRGILWTVGGARQFEGDLLPGVSNMFMSVIEVSLTAEPQHRVR